jgi:hypothetical protein
VDTIDKGGDGAVLASAIDFSVLMRVRGTRVRETLRRRHGLAVSV